MFSDKLQTGRTGHYLKTFGKQEALTIGARAADQSTRVLKKVTTVNELIGLLSQEGQKQTHRSARQISRETGLTQCSIVRSFTAILV